MKKIYLLTVMMCMVSIGFAQLESTWFLPSGIPSDWKDVPYPKSKYVIQYYKGFDANKQNVMDVWNKIPNEGSNDKYIMDRDGRRLPNDELDLTAKWKAIYDDNNLYVLQKVTDNDIQATTEAATSEQFELQLATYPNSVPMETILPLAPDANKPLDDSQVLGYWNKLGSYFLSADATGNEGHTIDYSKAYNGTVNWSVPFPDGITTKFTKIDKTSYTMLWKVPFNVLNDFVPSKDTAISIEVKVLDFDLDETKIIQACSNSEVNNVYMTIFYAGIGKFDPTPVTSASSQVENNEDYRLYPNPVEGKFTIQSSEKINSVSILDMAGRTVKMYSKINGQLDISDLQNGLYMVKMKDVENRSFVKKIVKK